MARWFVDRSAQRGIPSVSLRRLLPEATFTGVSDLLVSGCSSDTRWLDPGQVFVAIQGPRRDGHDFVGLALERGASAVVVERPTPEAGRLQVLVPDARRAFARISHALAGEPSNSIEVLGIAGTTAARAAECFLQAILEADGQRVGRVNDEEDLRLLSKFPSRTHEPSADVLANRLNRLVDRRQEVALVGFSNSQLLRADADGLSLAGAMTIGVRAAMLDEASAFAARKGQARLFRRIVPDGFAVVRADDPDAELLGAVNLGAERISYAREGPADVTARITSLDHQGTRFFLQGFSREVPVQLRLVGLRQLDAALAAAALAGSRGVDPSAIVAGLESVTRLPGHLDGLGLGGVGGPGVAIYHDRAQSAPALAEALGSLRDLDAKRVFCIMAAGDDLVNLAKLGQVAEACSDAVLVAPAESFRGNTDAAIDRFLAGFRRPGRVRVASSLQHAIALIPSYTRPGDALLLAGSYPPEILQSASRPSEDLRRSA